jgi:hypothetical protein
MPKRLMIWTLAVIVFFGALPIISSLLGLLLLWAFNCEDEASRNAVVFGVDLCAPFYWMALAGWLIVDTVPLAGLALIVWFIALIVLLLIHRHRRAGAERASTR